MSLFVAAACLLAVDCYHWLLSAEARALTFGAFRYARLFDGLQTPPIPNPLRAELQMPGLRLWDATLRAVGLRHDCGPEL